MVRTLYEEKIIHNPLLKLAVNTEPLVHRNSIEKIMRSMKTSLESIISSDNDSCSSGDDSDGSRVLKIVHKHSKNESFEISTNDLQEKKVIQ
jgi:hypothetical protein